MIQKHACTHSHSQDQGSYISPGVWDECLVWCAFVCIAVWSMNYVVNSLNSQFDSFSPLPLKHSFSNFSLSLCLDIWKGKCDRNRRGFCTKHLMLRHLKKKKHFSRMVSCYRIVFRFLCKREPFRKVGRSSKKTNRCTYIILLHFLVFSLEVLSHTMHTILWSYNDGVSSECATQAYK